MSHCFRSSYRRYFVKKSVLRNFAKLTEKHLCQGLFFNKVADLYGEIYVFSPNAEKCRSVNLLKKSLWYRCFPVNFAKFLRTLFLQNTSGRLLRSFLLFFFQNLEKTVEENNKLLMEVRPLTFSKILFMSVQYVNKLTKH